MVVRYAISRALPLEMLFINCFMPTLITNHEHNVVLVPRLLDRVCFRG